MSSFTAHPVNAMQCSIKNHKGRSVGWAKRVGVNKWRLYDLNLVPFPHNHVASPDAAAKIFQSL